MVRQLLAVHAENEDLLSIGAYRHGNNRSLDTAVQMGAAIDQFLRQETTESSTLEEVLQAVTTLAKQCQLTAESGERKEEQRAEG